MWQLRITLDSKYTAIVDECRRAIKAVAVGKRANVLQRRDSLCVDVSVHWKHWPCVFPQHGAGPKHLRTIELVEWQQRIVAAAPKPFLRGLIHSDGCRIIATARKGSHIRRAARYAFSNRSEDILQLFATACASIGVHFTRPTENQIAVYRLEAVKRLDEFIGPKR